MFRVAHRVPVTSYYGEILENHTRPGTERGVRFKRINGREDGAKTDVKVFEKQKDGSFAITQWTKATAPDLFDKLDDAIINHQE